MPKGACGIDVVSWVDTHFLDVASGHISHISVEVDVGTERLFIAVLAQLLTDISQILCLTPSLRGQSHQFAAGIDNAFTLRHASIGVIGRCGSHRLHAHWVVTTDAEMPHMDY